MVTLDPDESEGALALLSSGAAPLELRRLAARGLLPLDAEGRIRALLAVWEDPDPRLAAEARRSLEDTPPNDLARFVAAADARAEELDTIARISEDATVLEQVVRHRQVSDRTLDFLAPRLTGDAQDALVGNQVRLLRRPSLIELLAASPHLTADARRRLNEIKEEFFEKGARGGPVSEPLVGDPALPDEEPKSESEERPGEAAARPEPLEFPASRELYQRIMGLSVPEKMKLAYSGSKEERRLLIGDPNKLVGLAVLKSRGITITEVESFCAMRHLEREIFEKIAVTRDWIRRPSIVSALVRNPKVPLTVTLPLVARLDPRELKAVARDRNLPDAVRVSARRIFFERRR